MLKDLRCLHVCEHIVYNRAIAITNIDEGKLPIGFQSINVGQGRVTVQEFKKGAHVGISGMVSSYFTKSCVKVPSKYTIPRKGLKF